MNKRNKLLRVKSVSELPDPLIKSNFHSSEFVCFKDDFQSVLRTLENLFTVFVLFPVRYHKL